MEEPIIEAIALTKNFGQKNQYSVLKNINLKIYKGEFIAITGASGSGKSTLLNLLSGLEKPTSGEILYNGDNISNFSDSARSNFRNKTIGFVFQSYNLQSSQPAINPPDLYGPPPAIFSTNQQN
ncbi:ATP-binding cassette domain-containing protein [TM7 phylum sp. oral taxon 351]|nr:ATP-binding cassette domain-containing protein [TM7 phylum sp. oral taxon 351]